MSICWCICDLTSNRRCCPSYVSSHLRKVMPCSQSWYICMTSLPLSPPFPLLPIARVRMCRWIALTEGKPNTAYVHGGTPRQQVSTAELLLPFLVISLCEQCKRESWVVSTSSPNSISRHPKVLLIKYMANDLKFIVFMTFLPNLEVKE